MRRSSLSLILTILLSVPVSSDQQGNKYILESGHPSLQAWQLQPLLYPKDNQPNAERNKLGKTLFFDVRLSKDSSMSCATCHNPILGWSDGLPQGKGFKGIRLARATPSIMNIAYNDIFMWDVRFPTLEKQALGPIAEESEMNMDLNTLVTNLRKDPAYRKMFDAAYPGEEINNHTLGKAIASFERTVISTSTPFDRWISGDKNAMTQKQINGFAIFLDEDKGNCVACHQAPNFTDNGFHNVGLASFASQEPDLGRYKQRPLQLMRGAFKTPALRDIEHTAPYFHDGSSNSLEQVIEHYAKGGEDKSNLSPSMKNLQLSKAEKSALLAFLKALTPTTNGLAARH